LICFEGLMMLILKWMLLVICALGTVGFGICGVWGVAVDFPVYLAGCKEPGSCTLFWVMGWCGVAVAVVLGCLAYWLNRSIRAQDAKTDNNAL
jgi:phosphotransferase system  glucose/maltose/N-acetylglucosamine-specific IIC component